MNVREGLLFVILSFLACSALARGAVSSDPWCSQLTEKDFSITMYDYDQSQIKFDDFPPFIEDNPQKTIEGKSLEFQEDRAKVIHITALNPQTLEYEESYLLDDTYFFSSFLAVSELINKSRQGQSITQGEINGAQLLLNELRETIDEVDDSLFGWLKIEANVNHILALLEEIPLDIEALSRTLDTMGENNYYQPSDELPTVHLRGYERNKKKDELGSDVWSWESFKGPRLYGLGGSVVDYQVSLADQLFTSIHHTLSPKTIKGCTKDFAKSTVEAKNVLIAHRTLPTAVLDLLRWGDSRTENVPVSVQRNKEGLR